MIFLEYSEFDDFKLSYSLEIFELLSSSGFLDFMAIFELSKYWELYKFLEFSTFPSSETNFGSKSFSFRHVEFNFDWLVDFPSRSWKQFQRKWWLLVWFFRICHYSRTQDRLEKNSSMCNFLKLSLVGYTAGNSWSKFVCMPNWQNLAHKHRDTRSTLLY